jgi:hypothetical protein
VHHKHCHIEKQLILIKTFLSFTCGKFWPFKGNVVWCANYFILLCLMPDDFTCQGGSASTRWVKFPYFAHTIACSAAPYPKIWNKILGCEQYLDNRHLPKMLMKSNYYNGRHCPPSNYCFVHSNKCLFSACRNVYNGDFENECHWDWSWDVPFHFI